MNVDTLFSWIRCLKIYTKKSCKKNKRTLSLTYPFVYHYKILKIDDRLVGLNNKTWIMSGISRMWFNLIYLINMADWCSCCARSKHIPKYGRTISCFIFIDSSILIEICVCAQKWVCVYFCAWGWAMWCSYIFEVIDIVPLPVNC